VLAGVSALSSLALDLARDSGVTLVGYQRADSTNIYSWPDRVTRLLSVVVGGDHHGTFGRFR
jgi:FdhD protein